jgi:hypothetical protein
MAPPTDHREIRPNKLGPPLPGTARDSALRGNLAHVAAGVWRYARWGSVHGPIVCGMAAVERKSNQDCELDRMLDNRHATVADRSTREVLAFAAKLAGPGEVRPYAALEALEQLRSERL